MTPDERARVRETLEMSGGDAAASLARFTSAEQLHQWLLHYNVNDGLLPCRALAEHPLCDRGTAHFLYWQFHELVLDPRERRRTTRKRPEWNVDALLTILEDRFSRNDVRSAELHFDPIAWLQLTEEQRQALVAEGIPPERLSPVGHKASKRASLEP